MSLRLRLILLTVAMVALVAIGFSAVQLRLLASTLTEEAAERSTLASQQVKTYLIDHIAQHSNGRATPATLEDARAVWKEIVATDPDIAAMLEKMMSLSHSLIEINVADEHKIILVSSNPSRAGSAMLSLEPIVEWAKLPLMRRLRDVMGRSAEYEVIVPIGVEGKGDSIFTVQAVSSGVLLRNALVPEVTQLALISSGILVVALLLTLLATQTILRPLRRIEDTIDRIAQGNYGGEESRRGQAREFAAVESKLNMLGQKFQGAREDATELRNNVGKLLERMATQIDVSARLAAISRLTGGVAHEIKNPLNAISLRLDLLKAKLGAPEEELAADIAVLSKEVLRLDRVVKTFLDFSRPIEPRFKSLDLAELVSQVCDLLSPQAKAAKVEVWLEKPSGPVNMRGDADMLLQVILNLLTNAIEAMKDTGGYVGVMVASNTQGVDLNVADTGPGINPKLADQIFNLYYTTKAGGSGIGLAMAYRAVQLHNGSIGYTSEPGRGTTFHVQFPAIATNG